jgi:hypothetical protein
MPAEILDILLFRCLLKVTARNDVAKTFKLYPSLVLFFSRLTKFQIIAGLIKCTFYPT